MGKAGRWLRLLLGSKKSQSSSSESSPASRDKGRTSSNSKWGLIKSSNTNNRLTSSFEELSSSSYIETLDANKHAIAVAAATAAVAEAALAAAQAAAEVVRLTTGGTPVVRARSISAPYAGGGHSRERQRELAAIKIQSAFRAYLARRALRALRGLVKLQALVRGRIVRKQSADMLRRMQAMARIQGRACASRSPIWGSPHSHMKFTKFHHPVDVMDSVVSYIRIRKIGEAVYQESRNAQLPLSTSFSLFPLLSLGTTALKRYEMHQRSYGTTHGVPNLKRGGSKSNFNGSINVENLPLDSCWLDRWMEESTLDNHRDTSFKSFYLEDEKSDKILEIDTWKPHYNPRRSDKTSQTSQYVPVWKDRGLGTTIFDPISGLSNKFEKPNPSVSSGEVASLKPLKFPPQDDQVLAWTAENSPCVHSASSRPGSSSRRGPFTPTMSECTRSLFGDYLGHPNYMANTESSLARVRSQSAPRQRMQSEKLGTGRKFVHVLWDAETNAEKGSTVQSNFRSKAYPGSGRSDSLEMPLQDGAVGSRMPYYGRR